MSRETILNEPWTTAERQHVAMQFGVWSFLATEALFFGGLFLFYAFSRYTNSTGFTLGAREADIWFGTANTVVLMTSSLTMAVAERATKEGLVGLARAALICTILLGVAFLIVKGFEYRSDIEKDLIPGPSFRLAERGAAQFWSFYWTGTVIHAIHLTIGLGIVARLLFVARADLPKRWTTAVGTALYWHLVDIVWVILFPLIYLVGSAMTGDMRRKVILAPIGIWAGLMLLLTLTVFYAYWPGAPIKPEVGLTIGISKALLIALFFMQLRNSAGLVKLASMAGLLWGSLLFMLSFADLLTR